MYVYVIYTTKYIYSYYDIIFLYVLLNSSGNSVSMMKFVLNTRKRVERVKVRSNFMHR